MIYLYHFEDNDPPLCGLELYFCQPNKCAFRYRRRLWSQMDEFMHTYESSISNLMAFFNF